MLDDVDRSELSVSRELVQMQHKTSLNFEGLCMVPQTAGSEHIASPEPCLRVVACDGRDSPSVQGGLGGCGAQRRTEH